MHHSYDEVYEITSPTSSSSTSPSFENPRKRARYQLEEYINQLSAVLEKKEEEKRIIESTPTTEQMEYEELFHSRNDSNMTLVLLCADIALHICSFLTFKEICKSMSAVCTLWRDASFTAVRNVSFIHDDIDNYMTDEEWDPVFNEVLMKHCHNVEKFSLAIVDRVEVFQNSHLLSICEHWCHCLKSLRLVNCPFITESNGWPLIGAHLKNLRSLCIHKARYLTEANVMDMFQNLIQLEDVTIMDTRAVTNEIVEILCKFHPSLTRLNLAGTALDNDALLSIGSNLKKLQLLDLRQIEGDITDEGLRALSNLHSTLKALSLSGGYDTPLTLRRPRSIQYLSLVESWKNCQSQIFPIRFNDLQLFVARLLSVAEASNEYVTDFGVMELATLTNLECLRLNSILSSYRSTYELTVSMPFLRHLNLSGSPMASCGSLLRILTCFRFLKSLNVSMCANQFNVLCTEMHHLANGRKISVDFQNRYNQNTTADTHTSDDDTPTNPCDADCQYATNVRYYADPKNHHNFVQLECLSVRESKPGDPAALAYFLTIIGSKMRVLDILPGFDQESHLLLQRITEDGICPKLEYLNVGPRTVVRPKHLQKLLKAVRSLKQVYCGVPRDFDSQTERTLSKRNRARVFNKTIMPFDQLLHELYGVRV
jgi:hypothetical protein